MTKKGFLFLFPVCNRDQGAFETWDWSIDQNLLVNRKEKKGIYISISQFLTNKKEGIVTPFVEYSSLEKSY